MTVDIEDVITIAGVVLMLAGAALIYWPLCLIVAGGLLVALGVVRAR